MTSQTPNSASCHKLPLPTQFRAILGRSDDLKANVLFQMFVPTWTQAENPLVLEGVLTGPISSRASTLPIRQNIRIQSQKVVDEGTEILAHSVLTEPAFWTPHVPMLYLAKCKITYSNKVLASLRHAIGLRRLGIRNHSLWLDGHRFVMRGITQSNRTITPSKKQLATSEDDKTARVFDLPAETFSQAEPLGMPLEEELITADEIGCPIAIRIHPKSEPAVLRSLICRLTSHPSVFLTVLPSTLHSEALKLSAFKGTMLFAIETPADIAPPELPKGIDLAVVRITQTMPDSSWKTPPPYPVIAWQNRIPSQRKECDRLQAMLANWRTTPNRPPASWDWAGYLVGDESINQ